MSTPLAHSPTRVAVRSPFRVLAALAGIIGIAGFAAAVGIPFLLWRGARAPTIGDIVMLPLIAWFVRLMWHAVIYGKTPVRSEYWPLASRGVWNAYMLLLLAYWMFKP